MFHKISTHCAPCVFARNMRTRCVVKGLLLTVYYALDSVSEKTREIFVMFGFAESFNCSQNG